MPYDVYVTYDVALGLWKLLRRFVYVGGVFGKAIYIEVPEGFKFDLASIPRVFWRLIAPFELSVAAPLVHDYLYRYKGFWALGKQDLTRAECDRVFFNIMTEEGVVAWRRYFAYWAVRVFGGITWERAWRPHEDI